MTIKNATQIATIAPPAPEPSQVAATSSQPASSQPTAMESMMPPTTTIDSGADVGASDRFFGVPREQIPGLATEALAERELNDALSRDIGGITRRDVDTAHSLLGDLPGEGYSSKLQDLEGSGRLSRYIRAMDTSQEAAFLTQLQHNGLVEAVPGRQVTGNLNPPSEPDFLLAAEDAPDSVRGFIMNQNVELAGDYEEAYGQYMDRYVGEADSLDTPQEYCEFPDPHPSMPMLPPGLNDEQLIDFTNELGLGRPTEARGMDARADAYYRVSGAPNPGTFNVTASFQASAGGHSVVDVGESAVNYNSDSPLGMSAGFGDDGSFGAQTEVGQTTFAAELGPDGDFGFELRQGANLGGFEIEGGIGFRGQLVDEQTTSDFSAGYRQMCDVYF